MAVEFYIVVGVMRFSLLGTSSRPIMAYYVGLGLCARSVLALLTASLQ
jgi:hypothetical protein